MRYPTRGSCTILTRILVHGMDFSEATKPTAGRSPRRRLLSTGIFPLLALPRDKLLVLNAVEMCEALAYTNAVPSLKALALNPLGIYRDVAMTTALKFSPIDDATTQFVESMLTNTVQYTAGERLACYWGYARRLRDEFETGDAYGRAVRMFYRNRLVDWIGGMTVDRLLSERIDGYVISSNRLDTALFMLAPTNTRPQFVEYFTTVTNQLLSSGQPLQWINVGASGNCR